MSTQLTSAKDAGQPLRPMSRGTLSRLLVIRTAALVAFLSITLGLTSTLAVQRILMNQASSQLATALSTQDKGQDPDTGSAAPGSGGMTSRPRGIQIPGLPNGTVVVTQGLITRGGVIEGGGIDPIATAVANTLLSLPTGQRQTITLNGLGTYLAEKVDRGFEYDVVAISLAGVRSILAKLIALEAILTALAVAAAIVISRTVIVRALRPLHRLAAAATDVSTLELGRGEVALPVRVLPADADPSNEVGRVGQAFNYMLNNVEGALAARHDSEMKVRQFVADASHELRNPLAAIRGYAELTRRERDQLPADTQFAIGRIEAESSRMSKLVEDMLLLARLDNGPNLSLEPVNVVDVVLNAVSDAQVAGPEHDWGVDLPAEPVIAHADAHRLHQVVVNLLANARTHTPPGTKVDASVRTEGQWAVITVTDNGPGIDPAVLDHVFERFARADTARTHSTEGSTGLGLAIVAAVMEAHGGTASVTSVPGHTEFILRLPLQDAGRVRPA